MDNRDELDIHDLDQPLATGTTLIEASAGTGKTYTIAAIFLRLIVEHGLRVDQILVTTFTKPATAELRDRVRRGLHAAHEAFRVGASDEPLLRALLAKYGAEAAEKRRHLRDALRGFDEAAIDTIHAFCQRVLTRFAFESGAAGDPEFITDESDLLHELACDFWRSRFYQCDECLAAAARFHKLSPGTLAKLLADCLTQPTAEWIPKPAPEALAELRAGIAEVLAKLRALWPSAQPELRRMLFRENAWAKLPFNNEAAMEEALAGVHSCLTEAEAPLYAMASFFTFATSAIPAGTRAKATSPQHPFFDLCEELQGLVQRCKLVTLGEFLTWAPEQLRRRKERANLVSFTDLLSRLHQELGSERGPELRERIREQYPAALIDEFQDTDPLQDAIFESLFGAPGRLFLIGDPKQAIFGFRGADVFTYLAASKRAGQPLTLGTNFRSTTSLVTATNALFSQSPRPFVLEDIRFDPAKSAGREDAEKNLASPLHLWVWSEDGSLRKTELCDRLADATAGEIARLLGTRAAIPSDIAVLTGSNAQAAEMQERLRALGVPSALLTTSSVFQTREAREMWTLLSSISRPQDERRLRAALLTDLLALSVVEVHALTQEGSAWEGWSARFHQWHDLWRGSGFIAMFRRLLRETGARARLLARPDGERRLTNLLHLAEIVQCAATEDQLGPPALVKWLAERIADPPPRQEAHELRLERDDEAVRIVTVHKSKGLEYNIVFCPFAWEGCCDAKTEGLRYHDDDSKPVLDLGSDSLAQNRPRAVREELAEDVRLLYVALTRAKHRCHVAVGRFTRHLVSASNWLLQGSPPPALLSTPPDDDLHGALEAHFKAIDETAWRRNLEAVAARSGGTVALMDVPSGEAPRYQPPAEKKKRRAARRFRGEIERDFTISSFSSLTSEGQADAPERFAPPWTEDSERAPAADSIHAFPAGARTGVCLHEIFERLDFTDLTKAEGLVAAKLKATGFDADRWKTTVTECVRRVLHAPMPGGFRLAEIPQNERLVEREFHLPVHRLEPATLARLAGLEEGDRLQFTPQTGWLKGFIDLVFRAGERFYVIDWKSNRLGPDGAAYSAANVSAAMASHHYALQAQLYAVALHRYLRQRVPGYDYERHFGGMTYLFVRGVDPDAPGQGVWHHRPEAAALAALDAWLTKP